VHYVTGYSSQIHIAGGALVDEPDVEVFFGDPP
jgi:hypothetical protein